MGKAVLHNLIDLLNDADTDTIYNVLLRFIPSVEPMQDEIEALAQEKIDIANGDYMNLADVDWDAI